MTRDEFRAKYRGQLLLLMTEAWAVRNEGRAELGSMLDSHHTKISHMLAEMWNDLNPDAVPAPAQKPSLKVVQ